jgi:hypothetical protein
VVDGTYFSDDLSNAIKVMPVETDCFLDKRRVYSALMKGLEPATLYKFIIVYQTTNTRSTIYKVESLPSKDTSLKVGVM